MNVGLVNNRRRSADKPTSDLGTQTVVRMLCVINVMAYLTRSIGDYHAKTKNQTLMVEQFC
jgi:hypothetical protein